MSYFTDNCKEKGECCGNLSNLKVLQATFSLKRNFYNVYCSVCGKHQCGLPLSDIIEEGLINSEEELDTILYTESPMYIDYLRRKAFHEANNPS